MRHNTKQGVLTDSLNPQKRQRSPFFKKILIPHEPNSFCQFTNSILDNVNS